MIRILYSIGFFALFSTSSTLFAQDSKTQQKLDSLYDLTYASSNTYEHNKTLEQANDLIDYAKAHDNDEYLYYGYDFLASVYQLMEDSIQPALYSKKALQYAKNTGDDGILADAYNNLASSVSIKENSLDEQLLLYKKALAIERTLQDSTFLNPALNIAELYYVQDKLDSVIPYLEEAEQSIARAKNEYDNPKIYTDMLRGRYYEAKNVYAKADELYTYVYKQIEKDSLSYLAVGFYEEYADFLNKINKPNDAIEVYKKLLIHTQLSHQAMKQQRVLSASAKAQEEEMLRIENEAFLKEQLTEQKIQRKEYKSFLFTITTILLVIFITYLLINWMRRRNLIRDLKDKNSDLIKAKRIADHSIREKSRFFSTVSHEMRTPLYGVIGVVSLLEDRKGRQLSEEELNSLKFSSQHLLGIINDLLDVSKLEDNKFQLNNRPFDLTLLVNEVTSTFDQSEHYNKNKIVIEYEEDCPKYIVADPKRISQILLNLISNSMKFTNNGTIWVRVKNEGLDNKLHNITFEIEDTGIGIDKHSQKLIFKEFTQIEENQRKGLFGTGLGLSIVQKLLHKMGSDIELESEKGKGAKFSFTLKLQKATIRQVLKSSMLSNNEFLSNYGDLLNDAKILVIDDNKINLMVTKRILESHLIKVSTVTGGQKALQLLQEESFDLILTDINMPEMDGFETAIAIRKIDKKVPIIALTASDAKSVKEDVEKSGMNSLITKPYEKQDLFNTIVLNLPNKAFKKEFVN